MLILDFVSFVQIRCIHVDQLVGVEFSPNDETMATVSLDGTTRIWCTGSWAQKDVLTGHRSGVRLTRAPLVHMHTQSCDEIYTHFFCARTILGD